MTEVICDNNNILLEKFYNEDEDECFIISFSCKYDKESNILNIMRKNKFYELMYKLNKDLITGFMYDTKTRLCDFSLMR